MATYVIHLRLTEQGARDIQKAVDYFDLNKQGLGPLMGVHVKQFFMTTGSWDFLAVVEAKDDEAMAKFALTINGFGNVRTETCRAFDEQEFRTLVSKLP
jgi:uncharacterized protein with GYD domain